MKSLESRINQIERDMNPPHPDTWPLKELVRTYRPGFDGDPYDSVQAFFEIMEETDENGNLK